MSAKFAYAQWPWGTQSREEFIQSCKDMSEVGFEYFESVKAFIDTFKDSPEDFKSICDEYNIHPISFYFHLTGKHDDDIAELKDKIGFVRDCGIKTITVQGVWSPIPATHDDLIYASKTIIDYGSICKDYGILPCVHPHHNTTIMYESEIDYVMEHTDPALVGFAPDTAHLVAGKCDPVKIIDRYKDRVRFTHLKDITGTMQGGVMQDGVEVYENFRELGEGDVDFPKIFEILRSVHYDGYLCAELDRTRFTHKESAAISMKYLREHWR